VVLVRRVWGHAHFHGRLWHCTPIDKKAWKKAHSGRRLRPSFQAVLISRLIPGYVFPHYVLFENVQAISNDGNPDAQPNAAFYMLHMAYDTAVPGGQSNTTDPTNSIVTLAGLPL
jgi:hypothetical protein